MSIFNLDVFGHKIKIYISVWCSCIIVFIQTFNILKPRKNKKVCLCTPVKKENLYLNEFVEHYKNFNVDKIFLYDNNDIDGEHLEETIFNYIQSGFVNIRDFRGKKKALYKMMNDCYKKNYLKYDWLIFFEVDEYIYLQNYTDIKKFLNEEKFNYCQAIQLNWVMHTDNENIYYENKSLKERFPNSFKSSKFSAIKSILRGGIPNIKINCVHKLNIKLKSCNGFGQRTHITGAGTDKLDNNYYYIDHYFCKSTEEFINKINKGDVLFNHENFLERIKVYFIVNKATKEKLEYIEKYLHANISIQDILPHKNFNNYNA